MKKMKFYAAALVCSCALLFCAQGKVIIKEPEEKTSSVYNGIAVITQIRPAVSGSGADDSDYVEIYYDFVPVKNGMPVYSEIESSGRMIKLVYDNREIFHKNWVKKWDITSGKEYRVSRKITRKNNKINIVTYEVYLEPGKK